jgi:hypothetical protein
MVAGLGPGRGRVPCGPGGRTGLTGHRALSRATATMSHRGGQVRDDVTSWRLAPGGRERLQAIPRPLASEPHYSAVGVIVSMNSSG